VFRYDLERPPPRAVTTDRLSVASAVLADLADRGRRQDQPFLIGPDGRPDLRVNAFFASARMLARSPPTWGQVRAVGRAVAELSAGFGAALGRGERGGCRVLQGVAAQRRAQPTAGQPRYVRGEPGWVAGVLPLGGRPLRRGGSGGGRGRPRSAATWRSHRQPAIGASRVSECRRSACPRRRLATGHTQ
jgi:hypothetical protein